MRKVIFAINITADGCCDHTKQFVDEEKLEYFTHLTHSRKLMARVKQGFVSCEAHVTRKKE